MNRTTYRSIINLVGNTEREDGGICGMDNEQVLSRFAADLDAKCCPGQYTPNVQYLNRIVRDWMAQNIYFCAFVHSHPAGTPSLSEPDILYAKRIIQSFDTLDRLYLLLVVHDESHQKHLIGYCIKESDEPMQINIQIV